jgi:hypothetical protein
MINYSLTALINAVKSFNRDDAKLNLSILKQISGVERFDFSNSVISQPTDSKAKVQKITYLNDWYLLSKKVVNSGNLDD